MLRMYELIIERDRFYITMRQWVYYGIMGTITAAMLWASYALYHHEDAEPWLKYPFMVCTALGLASLFYDRNGKGGRKYGLRGKLVWGANARGFFLTALEERITEYDWARVQKIVVAEKMAVPNRSIVNGIYFGSDMDSNHNSTYKCDKRVIIFFDKINKSESRIGISQTMADLNSLIRVRKHIVEQKQKVVAALYEHANALKSEKESHGVLKKGRALTILFDGQVPSHKRT